MKGCPSPLLVVTDRAGGGLPLVERVEAALAGGARWIWFRERDLDADTRHALAKAIVERVHAAGARLMIGADVALAHSVGADGVHLSGKTSRGDVQAARHALGEGALIGVSAHSTGEIVSHARAGADYATLSPIFSSASKPGYGPALGPSILCFCDPGIPVLALGGVLPTNLDACRAGGFAGVAVMGGIMAAPDPEAATRSYLAGWVAVSAAAQVGAGP